MSAKNISLSIVIPAYNEERRIGSTIESITSYMQDVKKSYEIIVVDDGSRDGTIRIVQEKLKTVPHKIIQNSVNRGKGFSVRRGVLEATGAAVLFTDSDLSTPIEEIVKLEAALSAGYDVAVGSRSVVASDIVVRQNCLRELMGKTFNLLARLFVFQNISDSQCGFKAFTQSAACVLFQRQKINGFCFDAELLYLAKKFKFRVKEVGVCWKNSPESKVRILNDSVSMFIDLMRIPLIHLGEKY